MQQVLILYELSLFDYIPHSTDDIKTINQKKENHNKCYCSEFGLLYVLCRN